MKVDKLIGIGQNDVTTCFKRKRCLEENGVGSNE